MNEGRKKSGVQKRIPELRRWVLCKSDPNMPKCDTKYCSQNLCLHLKKAFTRMER